MADPPRLRLRDLPEAVNDISGQVVDSAIAVHRALGPGLLEDPYQACLAHELTLRGLDVQREVPIDVEYRGLVIRAAYFADLVVERSVIVEVKAVEGFHAIHDAKLLTYMQLLDVPLGILLNFHTVKIMEGGFKRLARRARAWQLPASLDPSPLRETSELSAPPR